MNDFLMGLLLGKRGGGGGGGGGGTDLSGAIVDRSIFGAYSNSEITKVGKYAFRYCTNLTSVNLPAVTVVDEYAFSDSGLIAASMPNVVTIGLHAFQNCAALTGLDMSKVKTVDGSAFRGSGITQAIMPALETIGNSYLFTNCTSLTVVDFGESLTAIPNYTFYGCTAFERLIIRNPSSVVTGSAQMFQNATIPNIYVPDDLVDSYKTTTYWKYSSVAEKIVGLSQLPT